MAVGTGFVEVFRARRLSVIISCFAVSRRRKSTGTERWQSGRMRWTRNPVYGSPVSRVRIPPFPPENKEISGLRAVFIFVPTNVPTNEISVKNLMDAGIVLVVSVRLSPWGEEIYLPNGIMLIAPT